MEREKKPENIQKVVRSVVVSLASANEIYNHFSSSDSLKNHNSFSLLKFLIEVKGDGNDLRYTLFGGRIEEGEDFSEAIQREIVEEAGLRFYGIANQLILGEWQYYSKKSGKREINLTYNPVLVCDEKLIGDPKIKDIRIINLHQFSTLIEKGELDGIPLEGHLSLNPNSLDKIEIDDQNRINRDQALKRILVWMSHIENYLQKEFRNIFNRQDIVTLKEFERHYEEILSKFMRKGLEAGIKKKEKITDEKLQLIEALTKGYLGRDILYYLPEFASHGIDWMGMKEAPKSVQVFMNFLKATFDQFLLTQELELDTYKRTMVDFSIPLENKITLLKSLNLFFREKLKSIFNVTDNDLDDVLVKVKNFFRELSYEMRVADSSLTKGLYQDFVLINEVENANYGKLLSLFLGLDTKRNDAHGERLIKFESGRQLLLLLKSLAGIKYYNKIMMTNRDSGRFQEALNSFFSSPTREEIIEIDENQKMRIRIRQRNGIDFIVDEKPFKTFTSFLRKSFYENIENISDFNSVSIVFYNHNQNNINAAKELIDEFMQYLSSQFPGFSVNIEDEKTYGTANFENFKLNEKISGKRVGSQSGKLVRTKLIISLDEEKLELTVYPFFSLKETNGNFWGWLEKITDDKNYVVRRLLAGANGIPSLYDLLFPPDLYPHHYSQKLISQYHH